MVTVYSVLWGDKYAPEYVYTLRNMVAKHLSKPHKFVCITDAELDGIETIKPIHDWPGWWQKMQLFHFADGPTLYLDLDVVITGNLDHIANYSQVGPLAAPANWAQSGHGGIQSSVMAWSGRYERPYLEFLKDPVGIMGRLWGDQEYLTELLDTFWEMPGVYSYKYHCRTQGEPPSDAAVVVFHGKPDPHECNEQWIKRSRSTLI